MTDPADSEEEEDTVLDLRDRMGPDVAMRPDDRAVIDWLRSSGGSLRDRLMKHSAADLIEEALVRAGARREEM